MDNATNNDSTLRTFSELLRVEREYSYDAEEHRIRCFPHIINICVQHTLSKYTQADLGDLPSTWTNADGKVIRKAEYIETVETDPVGLGRNIVTAIRASGQRRAAFSQTIENGNKGEVFTDRHGNTTRLANNELLLDCRTRWDSTYIMINRLRALRQVSSTFESLRSAS